MASTKIILRKDKAKRNGEAPLYVQVIKNRKTTKVSTGLYINPKYWDGEKEVVLKSHPNSKRMNIRLMKKAMAIVMINTALVIFR